MHDLSHLGYTWNPGTQHWTYGTTEPEPEPEPQTATQSEAPAPEDTPENERKAGISPGTILRHSWGYDMTFNEYCIVISVSKSGKTIKCQRVHSEVTTADNGLGAGRQAPGKEPIGEVFRLHVRRYQTSGPYYVGSYPSTHDGANMGRGCFTLWDGKPDYYNTYD